MPPKIGGCVTLPAVSGASVLHMPSAEQRGNPQLQFRIKQAGLDWVAATAEQLDLTRSELIRYALTYAATTPAGFAKHVRARRQAEQEARTEKRPRRAP